MERPEFLASLLRVDDKFGGCGQSWQWHNPGCRWNKNMQDGTQPGECLPSQRWNLPDGISYDGGGGGMGGGADTGRTKEYVATPAPNIWLSIDWATGVIRLIYMCISLFQVNVMPSDYE